MVTTLLTTVPILCLRAVFIYSAVAGASLYRSKGFTSVLGIAVTLAGLTAGRMLDRFVPLPRYLDDWMNYRDSVSFQITTKGERFLAVLSVEVAVMFTFAALVSFIGITLIRRDATGTARAASKSRKLAPMIALFVFAICLTARAKLSVGLAYLLAKANLL